MMRKMKEAAKIIWFVRAGAEIQTQTAGLQTLCLTTAWHCLVTVHSGREYRYLFQMSSWDQRSLFLVNVLFSQGCWGPYGQNHLPTAAWLQPKGIESNSSYCTKLSWLEFFRESIKSNSIYPTVAFIFWCKTKMRPGPQRYLLNPVPNRTYFYGSPL